MERFWSKVDKTEGCWNWTGAVDPKNGYGKFGLDANKTRLPHRLSYEWLKGEIPKGFDVDHLCKNRRCVNPAHLEAKTHFDNCPRGAEHYHARKTHCKNGHEFNAVNTRIRGNAWRVCRACERNKKRCR